MKEVYNIYDRSVFAEKDEEKDNFPPVKFDLIWLPSPKRNMCGSKENSPKTYNTPMSSDKFDTRLYRSFYWDRGNKSLWAAVTITLYHPRARTK